MFFPPLWYLKFSTWKVEGVARVRHNLVTNHLRHVLSPPRCTEVLLGIYVENSASDTQLGAGRMKAGFPGCSADKESACNTGDTISIPGSGRSPEERISYPLQDSWASLVAQMVNNPPAMLETWV